MNLRCACVAVLALTLGGCPVTQNPPEREGKMDMSERDMATDLHGEDMSEEDASSSDMSRDQGPEALEITSIVPASGPVSGGTQVTITGTGFDPGVTVLFGDVAAQSLQRASGTRLVAVSPPASAPGAVDVVVKRGEMEATKAGAFAYVAQDQARCVLGAQSPLMAKAGEASPQVTAQVYVPGDAGVEVAFGYGSGDAYEGYMYAPGMLISEMNGEEVHGATFTVMDAGMYRYAARYRVEGGAWTYCDLDGGEVQVAQLGHLEVTQDAAPSVTFCQTETPGVMTKPGVASGEIVGVVRVPGVTDAMGQGVGVEAELVWGLASADPQAWTNAVPATYRAEESAMGMPVEQYVATVTPSMVGDFGYVYRFRVANGSWSYCDTDGVQFPAESFEPAKVGALTSSDARTPEYCALQFPVIVTSGVVGTPMSVYGRVYEPGVTDVTDGDPSVTGELWVGPRGVDPALQPGMFAQVAATFHAPKGNDDEFVATFSPTTAGTFAFFYRFSVDGGQSWLSCDLSGAMSVADFDPTHMGALVVEAATPDPIDYCHIFAPSMPYQKSLASMDDPKVTMELYESGVTQGNGGSNGAMMEVQAGYGPVGTNPALGYTWHALPYTRIDPARPNNYQYEGAPYPSAPAIGSYGVSVRARNVGSSVWTYCDSNQTTMDYLYDAIPVLDVVP